MAVAIPVSAWPSGPGLEVRSEARMRIDKPPSAYLRKFYYDCLTHSEPALRMLLDAVGADRVVLGTDWPADMRPTGRSPGC